MCLKSLYALHRKSHVPNLIRSFIEDKSKYIFCCGFILHIFSPISCRSIHFPILSKYSLDLEYIIYRYQKKKRMTGIDLNLNFKDFYLQSSS